MPAGMPRRFALKELISPTVFPLGANEKVQDYLPLKEAAIQEYMAHQSIVQIYWADVRCLHPLSSKPLPMTVADMVGPDAVVKFHAACRNAGKQAGEASGTLAPRALQRLRSSMRPMRAPRRATVKLQMRMGIEFCDLGTLYDYLVVEPDPGEPALQHNAPVGAHSKARPLRDALLRRHPDLQCSASAAQCVVLAALDVAEAIRFMHRSATLHGDLKPQNILLATVPQVRAGRTCQLLRDLRSHGNPTQAAVSWRLCTLCARQAAQGQPPCNARSRTLSNPTVARMALSNPLVRAGGGLQGLPGEGERLWPVAAPRRPARRPPHPWQQGVPTPRGPAAHGAAAAGGHLRAGPAHVGDGTRRLLAHAVREAQAPAVRGSCCHARAHVQRLALGGCATRVRIVQRFHILRYEVQGVPW